MLTDFGMMLGAALTIAALLMQPASDWNSWLIGANVILAVVLLKQRQDVSQYRQLETKWGDRLENILNQREAQLQQVFESVGISLWDWNLQTHTLTWTGNTEATLGQAQSALNPTFEALLEHIHPDDRPTFQAAVERAIAQQQNATQELRVRWADGSTHWLSTQIQPLNDGAGQPTRLLGLHRNVGDRKWAEQTLQEVTQQIITVLESMSDGFFALNPDWQFTYVNPQSALLLKQSVKSLLGKNIWEAFPALTDSPFHWQSRRVLTQQTAVQFEAYFPPLDRWFAVRAYPIPTGLGVYLQDISDRKHLEESLQQQVATLMQADCFRAELLSVVSNELRSPLHTILQAVTQLKTRRMSAGEAARLLNAIEYQAKMQNQITDDLLDITELMHGEAVLNYRTIDLVPIINGVLRTLRPIAEARQIPLISRLALNVGLVTGDPERLQQVIENLLFSAIQFTANGGRVEVQLFSVESVMHFCIKGTGKGIESESLPFIFERFRRTDCSALGMTGGLGLAIARQLVEMQGGMISVSSEAGLGTIWQVQLPLHETAQRSLPAGESRPSLQAVKWGDR